MSLLDSEEQQVQLSSTTPLGTDHVPTDYNAETETDKTYQNHKSEDKNNFDYKLSHKFNRSKKLYTVLIKMYHIIKEMAIMLFLALTYAALTNNPPKISKSPPAVPFFPKSSVIQDWFRGELSAALTSARQSDIAFIMFYAPWDAESQAVRHEFDIAARFMQNTVTFIAINCWQPASECRNQYSKAYNWPILIAYLSRGKGIHYRGVNSAAYMIKFLSTLSRPLIRIHKEREMDRLLALNDAIVLGCLNALPGSYDYSVLYNAAINILENDPTHDVPFVVLTGNNNTCVNELNERVLRLHLWNETLLYPLDEQWKSESIITWVLKNLHQASAWALPTGTKSNLLSTYLQPSPSLILFTPKNPLAESEDYYNLLREVSLEYSDCEENYGIKLNSILINTLRIENYLKQKNMLEECGIKQADKHRPTFPSVVTYTIPKKWANDSCHPNDRNHKDSCSTSECLDTLKDRLPSQDCSDSYLYRHYANSNVHKTCGSADKLESIPVDERYPKISNLEKNWAEEKCRRVRFAHKIYPSVYSSTISDFIELKKNANIVRCSGLACKTNATLSFIALDSLQHFYFAERLGVDLSSRKDRTAAVIVNDKMETHHIIDEDVNDKTLRQFIINFTNGNVARSLHSESNIKSSYTHSYSHKKDCNWRDSAQLCLTELNSETFLPTVLQQGQVVIVLYYSRQCTFCSGISYTFLTVAKMFTSINLIRFVRIDGDINSLPWEFTMERYPTILLFPFRRKSETRVFPPNMPITVSNIVSFLLSNLNPTLKLHAMWILCNQIKIEEDRLLCIASTRSENLSLIDRTLRAWRNADALTKSKLLYKLQQLRNINLLLALSPQNTNDLDQYLSQLHWSADEQILLKTTSSQNKIKYIRDEL